MAGIFFDRQDHDILRMVNGILKRDEYHKDLKKLLNPHMHPRGIKEMAAFRELRIAYATAHLLDIMEWGSPEDRLNSLRSLHEDVVNITYGSMRLNTARVLIQIMKELLRFRRDPEQQLRLAHDFRLAASGKPGVVRHFLNRYHLLELSEEWNQIAFDDHIHDSSTKGRKSPTHVILDAWIKGLRSITVIYYNFVDREVISELLNAARIMDISVRIGIEYAARFRGKSARLIWCPAQFAGDTGLNSFLNKKIVSDFMDEGRKVTEFQASRILRRLNYFNKNRLNSINLAYGLDLPPLDRSEFMSFVGRGQPAVQHLAEFVYLKIQQKAHVRYAGLVKNHEDLRQPEYLEKANDLKARFSSLSPREIMKLHFDTDEPEGESEAESAAAAGAPHLMNVAPGDLVNHLHRMMPGCSVILNLSGLATVDALELIFDCAGLITHLEIYNLKDFMDKKTRYNEEIENLRRLLNEGNVVKLKRFVTDMAAWVEKSSGPDPGRRAEKFRHILSNIESIRDLYKDNSLKVSIGSDSAGRMDQTFGMGLAVKETLTANARRTIRRAGGGSSYETIPIRLTVTRKVTYSPRRRDGGGGNIPGGTGGLSGFWRLFYAWKRTEWEILEEHSEHARNGHVATVGGRRLWQEADAGFDTAPDSAENRPVSPMYLNTGVKNCLKVLIGFIPAFATFALTKDWWALAYLGAFIWFGITGLRNVIQSVVGGGGLRHVSKLRWKDYVSWERIADSLLYTGFSVPLLDYAVKSVLLDRNLGITTSTNPVALYAIMALVNGAYICSHNLFRGLPKQAAFGNLFRSILSIPIAILLNALIGSALGVFGAADALAVLQMWAAVISKFSSDLVAGFIEGTADRNYNVRARLRDYNSKIGRHFDTFEKMEILYPETPALAVLAARPDNPDAAADEDGGFRRLENVLIINSLDFLYFWMYQPRAQSALRRIARNMSPEEVEILVNTQKILNRRKQISQMFIDGIIGENFSGALAFYLDWTDVYLKSLEKYLKKNGAPPKS